MTRKPIRICNAYENIGGNATVHEFEDTIQIMADNNRTLVEIRLLDRGIEVSTGSACKMDGVILDSGMAITPMASNVIEIRRLPYREASK